MWHWVASLWRGSSAGSPEGSAEVSRIFIGHISWHLCEFRKCSKGGFASIRFRLIERSCWSMICCD